MSEWKEYKLGEVADILPGYAFKSKDFVKSGIPVIKIKDIAPPSINMLGTECVDTSAYELSKISKYIIGKGDYVVAMTGATIGKIGRQKENILAYLNQRVARIKAKEGVCDNFIYYTISGEAFQQFVQNNIDSNSAQENISATSIGRYPLMLPPLEEQKRIAGVLSSLDDKIDLLHRENATLEALAETLFRHYFIENPDPEWKKGKLTEFIKIIGGGTPKTSEPSYWNGDIGWLSGGDISENHKNYILNVEKYITQKGVDNCSVNVLPENSMIISARGTVGKYCLLGRPMAFSQSNYGILPKINGCYFFTYLLVSRYVEEMKNAAYGSVFDTITTKTFESIGVFLPNEKEVIVVFDNQVKPIFEKLKRNQLQIQALLSQRDTLLPRLMTGEVKLVEW